MKDSNSKHDMSARFTKHLPHKPQCDHRLVSPAAASDRAVTRMSTFALYITREMFTWQSQCCMSHRKTDWTENAAEISRWGTFRVLHWYVIFDPESGFSGDINILVAWKFKNPTTFSVVSIRLHTECKKCAYITYLASRSGQICIP